MREAGWAEGFSAAGPLARVSLGDCVRGRAVQLSPGLDALRCRLAWRAGRSSAQPCGSTCFVLLPAFKSALLRVTLNVFWDGVGFGSKRLVKNGDPPGCAAWKGSAAVAGVCAKHSVRLQLNVFGLGVVVCFPNSF